MKPLFKKPLAPYLLGMLVMLILIGAVLSLLTDEYVELVAVLGIEFLILSFVILHVYKKYLEPIGKARKVVDELAQGNYHTRVQHASEGIIAELSQNINKLARNLSELSIQDEMKTKQMLTVINNTDSGLALIDEKGYIHLVNKKFLTLFGKSRRDYLGYLYYDVIAQEEIQHTVQEAFLYETNIKHSFTIPGDIGERHIEVVGAPIFNERNILNGAVIVLYDITELKNVAVMRKDFVANVSHELRTPITSIKGFAETLLDGNQKDVETEQQFIKIIYDESKRLQYLVEDLLTLSMLEKDDFHLQLTEVNLSELIDEIQPALEHQAMKRDIKLITHTDQSHRLMADREKVKQVLTNLIGNAINYTQEHGEISLTVNETDESMRINVTDNGIGIEQEDLPRLFERFYRVDKARSRNTGGTGLGLAIVKHIVEVHGGKITVDSEINKGSSFTVYLPKTPPTNQK